MIDARGLSCPEPVVLLKKAIESKESVYEMLLDAKVAVENTSKFAATHSYDVSVKEENGEYKLTFRKK